MSGAPSEGNPRKAAALEVAWLDIADDPEAWRAAGFTVTESGDGLGRCMVGRVEHRLHGRQTHQRGLIGWGLAGPAAKPEWTDVDGIPTTSQPSHDPAQPTEHANGVFRIDHLVIRTTSTPRTVSALTWIGLDQRGHRDTNSAGSAVDMTFFWAGDTLLEIVGPPTPEASAPSRLSGIAYSTHDLDAAAALLGDRCTTPRDAVQPGRRIAALTKAADCTTRIALMTPHPRGAND